MQGKKPLSISTYIEVQSMKDNFILTIPELCTIINFFNSNYKHSLWFKMLYSFGVTTNELVNLKVKDLDLERNKIKVSGNKKLRNRILDIPQSLLKDLKRESAHKPSESFLFSGRKGAGIHPRTIQKILKKVEFHTKLSISIAKIRRTIAIQLYTKGWSEKNITEFLGYSSVRTTRIFIGDGRKSIDGSNSPLDDLMKMIK